MIVVGYVVAILLPLLFLYIIYSQDLFGQGKFRIVLLSFGWGLAAFGGSYGLNLLIGDHLFPAVGLESPRYDLESYLLIATLVAPIVEEVLKSLVLLFLGSQMTYFVDGAIYGFSSGIAFSILENVVVYLPQASNARSGSQASALAVGALALIRALSTCLMHGAASALVGTAIGRFRYGRGWRRVVSMIMGWVVAIGLHMGFNRLSASDPGFVVMLGALGIGIGGAILIVVFIRWGLREEKRWMEETLGLGVGVTDKEVSLLQKYEEIDDLLEPIWDRFGFAEEKIEEVASFLLKQGQLGIKRKAYSMSLDPKEQQRLELEIATLRTEMEQIRKDVGTYIMMCVRSVFPPEVVIDYAALQEKMVSREEFRASGKATLDDRLAARLAEREERQEPSAGRISLWGDLGKPDGGDSE
jgi:RsiW-degrading membrane proteinase PrsW (M82 family)